MSKKIEKDDYSRFINPNTKHRSFAWDRKFTIYAAATGGNNVILYQQSGDQAIRLNNKVYDQTKPEDIVKYCADIDRGYERYYKKFCKK